MKLKMLDYCENIIESYRDIFALELPIIVKVSTSKKWSGYYELDFDGDNPAEKWHIVKASSFFNISALGYKETLIHELIHCWQVENGVKCGHGRMFKHWVKFFKIHYGLDIS